jgi:acylphosphatase
VSPGTGEPGGAAAPEGAVRLTMWVRGRVQGVGFRWWTRSRALELGLSGWACNLDDGRVEVVAEGPRPRCEELLALLAESPPRDPPPDAPRSWCRRPGHVAAVTHRGSPARGVAGFVER